MPLAHAILASLDLQPMTGYDLKKFFDQSVGHFWSTTQSHIYKALNDLESQGWVQKHVIPQEDKPNRKEYSITEAGRAELRRWLTTPLPPTPVREAWLIQIFFSHNSSNAEIIALLEARLRDIRQVLEVFHSRPGVRCSRHSRRPGWSERGPCGASPATTGQPITSSSCAGTWRCWSG